MTNRLECDEKRGWNIEDSAPGQARILAHRLDIRLGVEKRKLIMEGNEKLTLTIDAERWAEWMNAVEIRINKFVDQDATRDILILPAIYSEKE